MKYNWKKQREKKAFIALEDGSVLHGVSFGAPTDKSAELVFNTGLSGYQEIISDPSYAGQIVLMTYPEIGNYGINEDDMESRKLFLNGFVVHEYNEPSNWRADKSLGEYLNQNDVPGISNIDTRALTLKIRNHGTLKAYIHCSDKKISEEEAVNAARNWEGLDNQDYASKVTISENFDWDPDKKLSESWGISEKVPEVKFNIAAYDYGIKWNILRSMRLAGIQAKVVSAKTPAEEVLAMNPDGVFFSNGPADPAAVSYGIENAEKLLGKVPLMGICLGHQILSLACGAETSRLKFGHHGCNHPIKNLENGKIEIASHNHNFAVKADSIPDCLKITHMNLNDNTVAGIKHKEFPMFAVQYHPEASPGPHDPFYLFEEFKKMMQDFKK